MQDDNLDLDDVCADHPTAQRQLAEMRALISDMIGTIAAAQLIAPNDHGIYKLLDKSLAEYSRRWLTP